jgi:ketosteroid isomerase-like protein
MSAELIERFYAAFARRDGDTMAACYAPDAVFVDPVFGRLEAEQTRAMWRMLTERAADLSIELVEHAADGDKGSARWIARYTFTQTGRPVVNDVRAKFKFRDGLIVEHVDKFGWWKWARQALGTPAVWLGWTPQLRLKVLKQARSGLARWMQERDGAAPAGAQDGDQGRGRDDVGTT